MIQSRKTADLHKSRYLKDTNNVPDNVCDNGEISDEMKESLPDSCGFVIKNEEVAGKSTSPYLDSRKTADLHTSRYLKDTNNVPDNVSHPSHQSKKVREYSVINSHV